MEDYVYIIFFTPALVAIAQPGNRQRNDRASDVLMLDDSRAGRPEAGFYRVSEYLSFTASIRNADRRWICARAFDSP